MDIISRLIPDLVKVVTGYFGSGIFPADLELSPEKWEYDEGKNNWGYCDKDLDFNVEIGKNLSEKYRTIFEKMHVLISDPEIKFEDTTLICSIKNGLFSWIFLEIHGEILIESSIINFSSIIKNPHSIKYSGLIDYINNIIKLCLKN